MRIYIETSSLLKLLITEVGTDATRSLWGDATFVATSRLTHVEARAALAAAARRARITSKEHAGAKDTLEMFLDDMFIIELDSAIATMAGDVAERWSLRAYDAVHLAAAQNLAVDDLVFATWDRDLARAGRASGFVTAGIEP